MRINLSKGEIHYLTDERNGRDERKEMSSEEVILSLSKRFYKGLERIFHTYARGSEPGEQITLAWMQDPTVWELFCFPINEYVRNGGERYTDSRRIFTQAIANAVDKFTDAYASIENDDHKPRVNVKKFFLSDAFITAAWNMVCHVFARKMAIISVLEQVYGQKIPHAKHRSPMIRSDTQRLCDQILHAAQFESSDSGNLPRIDITTSQG